MDSRHATDDKLVRAAWTAVFVTSGWGVVGVLLFLAWKMASGAEGGRADWSAAGVGWLAVYDVLTVGALLGGYWSGRLALRRRGLPPHWLMPVQRAQLVGNGLLVPVACLIFAAFAFGGLPAWLTALTVVAALNGLAMLVDTSRVLMRMGRVDQ